jgi:trehalose-6-phosphate synthase
MIPTRTNIDQGDNEYARVVEEAQHWFDKANEEFGTAQYKPVILRTQTIDNNDAILLGRAIRFKGGQLRHSICMLGSIRDGLALTGPEGAIAQDRDYPGLIVIPETIGAAQELGPLTVTYNPEDDDAFEGVLKKVQRIYDDKDCIQILRAMNRDMRNLLLQFDLSNWAASCVRLVAPSYAARMVASDTAKAVADAGQPPLRKPA